MRSTLVAHSLRRRPRPAGPLGRRLVAAVVETGAAVAGLEAGLVAQVNALDALLDVAASRQAPWQRPIATRVARGKG